MTIGIVIISALILSALICLFIGAKEKSGDYFAGAVAVLLLAGVGAGFRQQVIEDHEKQLACINNGKEPIEILDIKVCKL
jgi:hypothetical protein